MYHLFNLAGLYNNSNFRDNFRDNDNDNDNDYCNDDNNNYNNDNIKFSNFVKRIQKELFNHPVIVNNEFTKWWSEANLTKEQIRQFVVQFSVFSNQFLVAQLQKTINSHTLEGMRESKEILANEIGVIFKSGSNNEKIDGVDPELVSTTGTVDGGTFKFQAAHFEWIYKIAKKLNLQYKDIGRRSHGYDSTLFFCDELIKIYGSEDYNTAVAASYAIENWAAAGFWKDLINGLKKYNTNCENKDDKVPLSFFTWHDKIEDQHAEHTEDELYNIYIKDEINETEFITVGNEMLDAVMVFWNGLKVIID